jgi:glycosyltransferase involved in cell wall biosynthesis
VRIAQLAPPWIPVPPRDYGGTELMVANLVRGLTARGVAVVLFAARESTLPVPCFGPFAEALWPPEKFSENLHLAYALRHLHQEPVAVCHSHLENAAGVWSVARDAPPLVITLHTPLSPIKITYLQSFPEVHLVAVSAFQARQLAGHPRLRLIPHGLEVADYPFIEKKENFLLFLGRIYPDKGLHTAIRLARETERPLIIAGPVFPPDRPYFDQLIRPDLDGRRIIYLGPADFGQKVELLSRASALISPLEVDEAFGLVMLEAMACGTPVAAYRRGAVPEVVRHEETGFVAETYEELRAAVLQLGRLTPHTCREHVARNFSREAMVNAYLELYRSLS